MIKKHQNTSSLIIAISFLTIILYNNYKPRDNKDIWFSRNFAWALAYGAPARQLLPHLCNRSKDDCKKSKTQDTKNQINHINPKLIAIEKLYSK